MSFSVQAFQRETFAGKVRQVRLQSAIEENVVTYKVVIDVNNPDQKLLPGMTATVEFIVQEANDVFCVPNAALRFRPEPEQIDGDPPTGGGGWRGAQTGSLWVPSGDKVQARPVSLGIRSGRCTEVRGEGISEGMSVVTGVTLAEADEGGVTNPFQQGRSGRRSRGGF